MEKLMDLKIDFAFKQIFGKAGNEPILIAFLNAVLNPPADQRIMAVEILNPEIYREHLEDKAAVLDIRAKTEQNIHINIEIQLANKYDMEKRTLYYWSCIYSEQLTKGMTYIELAKTITINILNYRMLQQTERFHTCFHIYEDQEQFPLTDILEIHFIELPKLMDKWEQQAVNPHEEALVRWLLLLEADESEEIRRELEAIAMQDPVMKQVFVQWQEISRDPKKLVEYQSRRKAILDEFALVREAEIREEKARAAGKEEGIEVGIEVGKVEVARNMLEKGMAIEMIAEVTGLSVADIEAIRLESDTLVQEHKEKWSIQDSFNILDAFLIIEIPRRGHTYGSMGSRDIF